MADSDHLQILSKGIDVWNTWRKENPDIRPDLCGADLQEFDLHETNLSSCKFQNTNLKSANLRDADLSHNSISNCNLSYANLTGTQFDRCSFRSVNLNGAKFLNTDLSNVSFEYSIFSSENFGSYLARWNRVDGADFSHAKLTKTRFYHCNLHRAILREANLVEAEFSQCNLAEANLSKANLTDARLANCNLTRANLFSTNFTETKFTENTLADIDLSHVTGIDTINHFGPSTVDQNTLTLSGRLPEIFLRGCGLSDNFIQYIPSLFWVPQAIEFYSCFISYNHEDKSFARRLYDALQGRGIRCWLDEKQVLPGEDIYEAIDHGIKHWDKILLCCSKKSLTSWWVDNEIDSAFEKERGLMRERGKKVLSVIPLDLDGYMFSSDWDSGKKRQINSRLAANFVGWENDNEKFETAFEKVVQALHSDAAKKDEPPESKL